VRTDRADGGDVARREALRARFEREAQVTATLTSAHTVALYDFGVSEQGELYYVMELLDGVDLESLVREHGPLEPARAIAILRQVCHSLAEAHARGLVHRDVKPSNLVLCRQGLEHDFVKVLDFGLVGLRAGEEEGRISREMPAAGTPAYLAPEALTGNADARSDVYALGCVAHWLLTGTRVFEADDARALARAHLRDAPQPPSSRSELAIPPALDALVLRCLAKDPTERPASMTALAQALEACPSARPWSAADAERWWRLHRPEAPPALQPAAPSRRAAPVEAVAAWA
jgi:eukaryotic-like serine/threonine-protein kinase